MIPHLLILVCPRLVVQIPNVVCQVTLRHAHAWQILQDHHQIVVRNVLQIQNAPPRKHVLIKIVKILVLDCVA